ncbi:PREDICTED: protein FAM53B isoform X2 [Bison bison bison]|uniref:Protein FAM53B isoform X2 n=1 Tax=Bison bison bison TaxID=43346 RepID=A0A6P3J1G1_BISBB|nr:PREDICTED: protein FAM53B isoform X2 [Bison bison bison]
MKPQLPFCKMAACAKEGRAQPEHNCQTFSSLSCLNTGTEDRSTHSPFALHTRSWAALHSAPSAGGRTPAGTPVPEPLPSSLDDSLACREEPCCEEPGTAWRDRRARSSPCSLDGELDIEQIENN